MYLLRDLGSLIYRIFRNRWVQLIFFLMAIFLIVFYIWTNAANLLETIKNLNYHLPTFVIAVLIIAFTVFLGGVSWSAILKGFGQDFPLSLDLKVFFKSSLAKYIPGFVWQYLSRGHLISSTGVPPKIIPWVLAWEFAQILWTGIIVAVFSSINYPLTIFGGVGQFGWIIRAALLIGSVSAPVIFLRIYDKKNNSVLKSKLSLKWLIISTLIVCSGWILLGVGLYYALDAFGFHNQFKLMETTFVYSSSVIAGILVFPVPNGIGIREGIIAFFLSDKMPTNLAVIISSAIRVFIALFELMFGMISIVSYKPKIRE